MHSVLQYIHIYCTTNVPDSWRFLSYIKNGLSDSCITHTYTSATHTCNMGQRLVRHVVLDMILHPGYPPSILLPHSVWALSAFRASYAKKEWSKTSVAHKLVGGWFCHAFGGTSFRDILLGVPPSIIRSENVHKWWALACVAVYFSPEDFVHRSVQTKGHPLRILCRFVESIDACTTILGSFEKGRRTYPKSAGGAYALALAAALGGSICRYFDRKIGNRMPDTKTEWAQPTGSLERAFGTIALYALLRKMVGVSRARVAIVLLRCAIEMIAEFSEGESQPDLFVHVVRSSLRSLEAAAIYLRLGEYRGTRATHMPRPS